MEIMTCLDIIASLPVENNHTVALSPRHEGAATLRWNSDYIDVLCTEWARPRRKLLGNIPTDKIKFEPREMLGKLRCTLGQVKEEGEGAAYGTINQNFPEVYTGDILIVHRAWTRMRGPLKLTMSGQYVWKEVPVKVKAAEFGFSVAQYWINLTAAKEYVAGYIDCGGSKAPEITYTQLPAVNPLKALQMA